MCLSDIGLTSYTKDDPSESVRIEAYNTSVNRQWSSFLCDFGLSSVLRLPIESYFPIPANDSGDMDSLSTMFNCIIFPRLSSSNTSDDKIHLFCCALMPVGYLENMKIPEQKNHYVALCQPKNASLRMWNIQSFVPKPISPSIPLRETTVTNTAAVSSDITSSSLLHSPTNTIPNPKLRSNPTGPVKTKMKQLVSRGIVSKKEEVR